MSLRGYLFVLIATIIWGSMAVASKLAYSFGMSYMALSFYRALFFFLYATLYLTFKRERLSKILILIGSIFTSCMIISYMATVYLIGAAFAAFMINTAPIYVLLTSIFFLQEKLTKKKVIALVLSITGVYLLTQPELASNIMGIFTGILSGVSYAALSLTTRFYVEKVGYRNGDVVIYQLMWFSLIPIGTITLVTGDPLYVNLESLILAIYIGLLPTGVAYYFYGKGIELVEVSRVSIIATFETVAAALMAFFILGELMHPLSYVGGILIILGISLIGSESGSVENGKIESGY